MNVDTLWLLYGYIFNVYVRSHSKAWLFGQSIPLRVLSAITKVGLGGDSNDLGEHAWAVKAWYGFWIGYCLSFEYIVMTNAAFND